MGKKKKHCLIALGELYHIPQENIDMLWQAWGKPTPLRAVSIFFGVMVITTEIAYKELELIPLLETKLAVLSL